MKALSPQIGYSVLDGGDRRLVAGAGVKVAGRRVVERFCVVML